MKYRAKRLISALLLLPIVSFASFKKDANNFLVLSDVHLDKATSNIMEINPSGCNRKNDLDQATFEKLISAISDNIKNGILARPQFIIILGDIVGHQRDNSESVIENESVVFNKLNKNFPDVPIFYTFGNNDSLQINYGPFKDKNRSNPLKSPYDVAKMNGGWKDGFLSSGKMCAGPNKKFPCIIEEDNNNGFYSAYLKPRFRFISLNTVMFSPYRIQVTRQDAINQLLWLNAQLKLAQENKESVLIAVHVPPGNNVYDHSGFWLQKEQTAFLKLIKVYQNTIIGILASHTHAEELKIIKDGPSKNISGIYFIAGLSTSHGNGPSVKTFYFSKNNEKWVLSNYETFHFTMNHSNMVFNKLYDYTHYYCNNKDNDNLSNCLSDIAANNMRKYFSAGNPHYDGIMRAPADIVIDITKEQKKGPVVSLCEKIFRSLIMQ